MTAVTGRRLDWPRVGRRTTGCPGGPRSAEALRNDLTEKIDQLNLEESTQRRESAPEELMGQLKDLGYT